MQEALERISNYRKTQKIQNPIELEIEIQTYLVQLSETYSDLLLRKGNEVRFNLTESIGNYNPRSLEESTIFLLNNEGNRGSWREIQAIDAYKQDENPLFNRRVSIGDDDASADKVMSTEEGRFKTYCNEQGIEFTHAAWKKTLQGYQLLTQLYNNDGSDKTNELSTKDIDAMAWAIAAIANETADNTGIQENTVVVLEDPDSRLFRALAHATGTGRGAPYFPSQVIPGGKEVPTQWNYQHGFALNLPEKPLNADAIAFGRIKDGDGSIKTYVKLEKPENNSTGWFNTVYNTVARGNSNLKEGATLKPVHAKQLKKYQNLVSKNAPQCPARLDETSLQQYGLPVAIAYLQEALTYLRDNYLFFSTCTNIDSLLTQLLKQYGDNYDEQRRDITQDNVLSCYDPDQVAQVIGAIDQRSLTDSWMTTS